jgi:hypothetical protein
MDHANVIRVDVGVAVFTARAVCVCSALVRARRGARVASANHIADRGIESATRCRHFIGRQQQRFASS